MKHWIVCYNWDECREGYNVFHSWIVRANTGEEAVAKVVAAENDSAVSAEDLTAVDADYIE